jgi:hypothetical protein
MMIFCLSFSFDALAIVAINYNDPESSICPLMWVLIITHNNKKKLLRLNFFGHQNLNAISMI